MQKQNAKELLEKYKADLCTDEEKAILEGWYEVMPEEGSYPEYQQIAQSKKEVWELLDIPQARSAKLYHNNLLKVAATLLICLGIGLYFYQTSKKNQVKQERFAKNDIAPGGNKATLILAGGKRISLDDAAKGEIAEQSGVQITKAADGQLIYKITGVKSAGPIANNAIVTPKGGQYQVQLPDGTQVWMNANSILKFPAAFSGHERVVKLTGEAYFEVAKNALMPFKVFTGDGVVEVLGTHFNISSYSDEPVIKTTLFEGSVKVSTLSSPITRFLKPGQQAVLQPGSIVVNPVDTEDALAWKNGLFVFNNEGLESIMRKISRWYDVEVVYSDQEVKKEVFGGSVSRFGKVSEILNALEITGNVSFKVEGRKIIVNKKVIRK